MIRMIQSNVGQAKSYFSQALNKSDYFLSDDQERPGVYHGRLANRIGLKDAVSKQSFFDLCENINPSTGKPLTPRNYEDRTVGYDINFHSPKSLSVLNGLINDDHLVKAFESSVFETMRCIEADSMTRVRKNGRNEERLTGELVYASFTHLTARPVGGQLPDPHLHTHCFVFNATWDATEKEIKAGQFRDIKRDMPYYQAIHQKILSDKLIDLGYEIKKTAKSFEVIGVPQGAIDLFSKRTNEIGQFAKEHGITDEAQLSELGARTRGKKQKGLSMSELKTEWRNQLQENIPFEDSELDHSVRFNKNKMVSGLTAKDCVDFTLHHSFERKSVVQDRRLLASAYQHAIGHRQVDIDGIDFDFTKDRRIILVKDNNRNCCTTQEVLTEEKRMIELARKGNNKFSPLYEVAANIKLDGKQGEAIRHVLTTTNQVSIVRGAAGSGKTTLMTEAKAHIEKTGKQMFVVAPTSDAARGVLVNEGFQNAETVAKLLVDKDLQEAIKGQVLWVDEAGLLANGETTKILELADKNNVRLVFGGDTRQHSSVTRGDALRILNTVGGIKSAEVDKIRRQTNPQYLAAVQDLSQGKIWEGFTKLDRMGAIKTIDPLNPNEELVKDYIKAVKGGKSVLIISPTHQQGQAVTDDIRAELQKADLVGKREITATKFNNLNLTEAQKADWRNYRPGQMVQFSQNVPEIKRGAVCRIEKADNEKIIITDETGQKKSLPTSRTNSFNVFQPSEIRIAKGDKIRITRNLFDGNQKRLNNGQVLEVAKVSKSGNIQLVNKDSKTSYNLKSDVGHIDHAYCSTSYASQGKTVDQVFISQPASTFTATDAKQFYVSVSRGKHAVSVYTDDKLILLEHAERAGDRQSAIELVEGHPDHADYVAQFQRSKEYEPLNPDQSQEIELQQEYKDLDYEPGL